MSSLPVRLEKTLFGAKVVVNALDEIQGHVQGFFERFIIDEGFNYEVEAKFGLFIDRGTNERVSLPVLNTCVLTPGDWHRFESNLSLKQHRLFNEVFNKQVAQDSHHWRYKHEKTIDTVYFTPQRKKVRVSRDQEGHIVGLLEKHKVADMSIYCPASPFDIRLSINTETKLPLTTEEQLQSWTKQSERRKDRISYDFGHFIQVDLTQVRQQDVTTGSSITLHELELELIDVQRQMSHPDVGAHFISNVLDIARFASS